MLHFHQRDSLDRTILFHLQENSRQSTSCLSKKLRVARSTIHERITKLERESVILGYTAVLRKEKEKPEVQALLFAQVELGYIGAVTRALWDHPEIQNCFALTGEFDLFCSLASQSLEDLDAIVEGIASTPHVLHTHSKIILAKKFERISRHIGKTDTFL